MAKLASQAAIIGLGRLVNMAAAAGTMVVLARAMPDKASYGAVLLLLMLYMVLSQLFSAGLPQAIYYFLPRYSPSEQRGFLAQTVLLLMMAGALLGGGLYVYADRLGDLLGAPILPELLRIFAWYPVFMLPTLVVEGVLLQHNRPLTVSVFSVVIRVGMFCALVIPTWLHASLPLTISVWVLMAGVMCAIALCLLADVMRERPWIWHHRMWQESWEFSLPLAILTLIELGVAYLDRFIVSHNYGVAVFAVYSNATFAIPTVTMVLNATSVVLLAEFSRRMAAREEHQLQQVWRRASIKIAILIMASFGFLVFWGHETMRILFSNRFAESGDIFSIIVWNIPTNLFALRPLFVARGATSMLCWLMAFDFVVGVVCMLGFGYFFGVRGIAIGSVTAGYIGIFTWVYVYAHRVTKIGWKAFMPWSTMLTVLGLALCAGGLSRLLRHALPTSWPMIIPFALAIPCYGLLYITGLYLTRLLAVIVPAKYLPGGRRVAASRLAGEQAVR
jgi:O-antigen/teichoic acid export membrane protein